MKTFLIGNLCIAWMLAAASGQQADNAKTTVVATKTFSLKFSTGADGRLYQSPVAAHDAKEKFKRMDEACPAAGDGYIWEPALQVVHADGNTSTALLVDDIKRGTLADGREIVRIGLHDPAYPLRVTLCFRADRDNDVIEEWMEVSHTEPGPVKLERMASSALRLPAGRVWLTHFFGDWAQEMLSPITEQLTPGVKVLDSKLGVRAEQYQNPSFVLSFDGPPSEEHGRVLAGSLEWSGSFQCAFEDNGRNLRALCGVNPFGSAYTLEPGTNFVSPPIIWAWSDHGLGDLSRKLHRWARAHGLRRGNEPRKVLLNNWEATGFNFDFARIAGLFGPAADLGTEQFLLDDGWFGNTHPRVNDRAGLGDWQPNHKRFPDGMAPLAAAALAKGLEFGIWIEPEMVNPASALYEQHPDWTIVQPHREVELARNQLVLDLTRPEVQDFEWRTIQDVLGTPGVAYVKWDCNRYVTQPGSAWLPKDRQENLWIDYVNALYRLMDKTAATYPDTELMLCSGGGGRADYGALKYFNEFWPSDNTDPVERVAMQWDYSYFFPALALCGHVTRWGHRPMHFACSVAMSVRFGMDLDLNGLTPEERSICAGAVAAYKQIRNVTQLGDLYRLESPHGHFRAALNYVSPDQKRAVLFVYQLQPAGTNTPVKLQGLDPAATYTVKELNPAPGRPPLPSEGQRLTGEQLMTEGLVPSCAKPLEAAVIALEL